MSTDDETRLFELADLIHGVGRQLRPPSDLEPGLCSPLEINVMHFINRHPGTSARVASEATLLASSNFSRVLRGLVAKGLVRREVDEADARGVQLYLTALAEENFARMRQLWSGALKGIIQDDAAVDQLNATLRRIEAELVARARRPSVE